VSFSVPEGQFATIVGPSGCGKTTLLRILAGLEKATGGEARIVPSDQSRPLVAVVFQEQSIFPWATVFDNVAYGLRMRRVEPRKVEHTVHYFLEKTGLDGFARAYPHQLSGGMKQRVSIARALANDPEILLMDEPFAALDEQTKVILQEELLRIWEEHRKTVVFITHSIDEALVLSDRILVMTSRPGRIKLLTDVPFPRPRQVYELRRRPDYGDLAYRLWQELRDEVGES
jgi:NitT/TauT family transport system ATP-binding protein